jgi:hypothetical protein
MDRVGSKVGTSMAASGRGGVIGLGLEIAGGAAVHRWPEYAIPVMALGAVLIIWGAWGLANDWREKNSKTRIKLEPSHLILVGLIGAMLSSGIAFAGFIWQQYRPPSTVAPPTGTSGEGPKTSEPSSQTWTANARLTITFDNDLQAALASKQEGVRFYYWYHFPGIGVDFQRRQVSTGPGYVTVFLSLADPTHTNYNRVRVVGGGVLCEVLSAHAAGAVVRAMGDMRGRTLDIWFSKDPIPLD